jgi:hypothetical protein
LTSAAPRRSLGYAQACAGRHISSRISLQPRTRSTVPPNPTRPLPTKLRHGDHAARFARISGIHGWRRPLRRKHDLASAQYTGTAVKLMTGVAPFATASAFARVPQMILVASRVTQLASASGPPMPTEVAPPVHSATPEL